MKRLRWLLTVNFTLFTLYAPVELTRVIMFNYKPETCFIVELCLIWFFYSIAVGFIYGAVKAVTQ